MSVRSRALGSGVSGPAGPSWVHAAAATTAAAVTSRNSNRVGSGLQLLQGHCQAAHRPLTKGMLLPVAAGGGALRGDQHLWRPGAPEDEVRALPAQEAQHQPHKGWCVALPCTLPHLLEDRARVSSWLAQQQEGGQHSSGRGDRGPGCKGAQHAVENCDCRLGQGIRCNWQDQVQLVRLASTRATWLELVPVGLLRAQHSAGPQQDSCLLAVVDRTAAQTVFGLGAASTPHLETTAAAGGGSASARIPRQPRRAGFSAGRTQQGTLWRGQTTAVCCEQLLKA